MTDRRIIRAGRFLDGSGGQPRKDVLLTVDNGRITAIAEYTALPHDSGVVVDNLSHCIILPPLVDCSVSLAHSPSVVTTAEQQSNAEKAILLQRHIRDCSMHGVLGVANNDALDDLGKDHPGQHRGNSVINIRSCTPPIHTRQDGSAWGSTDADFIKIYSTPDIDAPDDQNSHPAPLNGKELCDLLHNKGHKKAVVVANGKEKVQQALEAGCDAIEQGYQMGEENLQHMARAGVVWIPSVLRAKNGLDGASGGGSICCRFSQRYVAPGKPVAGAEDFWKEMLTNQLNLLRRARELHVTTAVGTGAGNIGILHGESVSEELKLFIKAGYSLAEALRCGSENGARFFGMDHLGTLTVGRRATFLVTRGTVQQLPRKLAYLENIYIDGMPSPAYRKNPVKVGAKRRETSTEK